MVTHAKRMSSSMGAVRKGFLIIMGSWILDPNNFHFWCRSSMHLFAMIIALTLCKRRRKELLGYACGISWKSTMCTHWRLHFAGAKGQEITQDQIIKKSVQSYVKASAYSFGISSRNLCLKFFSLNRYNQTPKKYRKNSRKIWTSFLRILA